MVKKLKELFLFHKLTRGFVFRFGPAIPGKRAWFMIWFQKNKRIKFHFGKISFEVAW